MRKEKHIHRGSPGPVLAQPFLAMALVLGAMAAFTLTRLSAGAVQLAAWFIVAICAGGLTSLLQRRR